MPKPPLFLLALLGLVAAPPALRAAERLKGQASTFIQSFADSPVDWMPWGEAALARARIEQKPVFVFIGSFTSELSAAMRKQTFANPKTADWLNQEFVCVLVDRDERPDLAALYQAYVGTLKQLNGWPLNLFLTPDFQPFEGATYLSPSEDWGAPGFLKLAKQAQTAWSTEPAACRRRAAEAITQMKAPGRPAPAWDPGKCRSRLAAAAAAWAGTFDPRVGSYGDTPKAPEPELVRFMLLQSGDNRASALQVLRALATSAVRDPLDGGFFRRASDSAWRIPYPQKLLVDQARIAEAYLDAASGPDALAFRQCALGALDYALGALANRDGSFAGAQDAAGEDFTAYYTWTKDEVDRALGPDSAAFCAAHGVLPAGNVPAGDDPSGTYTGRNFLWATATADPAQAAAAARLLARRAARPAPPLDPRASAAAMGLFMHALARAGAQYLQPRYESFAHQLAVVVQRDYLLAPDGSLRHLPRSDGPATAQDYAGAILGFHALAQFTRDRATEALAEKFGQQLAARYFDAATGTYFAAPLPLPAGLFMRPTAGAEDPPSAEALAIPAHASQATAVAAQLSDALEEGSAQAPGDQLLALALLCGQAPPP